MLKKLKELDEKLDKLAIKFEKVLYRFMAYSGHFLLFLVLLIGYDQAKEATRQGGIVDGVIVFGIVLFAVHYLDNLFASEEAPEELRRPALIGKLTKPMFRLIVCTIAIVLVYAYKLTGKFTKERAVKWNYIFKDLEKLLMI